MLLVWVVIIDKLDLSPQVLLVDVVKVLELELLLCHGYQVLLEKGIGELNFILP